jgi:hypothetical protein
VQSPRPARTGRPSQPVTSTQPARQLRHAQSTQPARTVRVSQPMQSTQPTQQTQQNRSVQPAPPGSAALTPGIHTTASGPPIGSQAAQVAVVAHATLSARVAQAAHAARQTTQPTAFQPGGAGPDAPRQQQIRAERWIIQNSLMRQTQPRQRVHSSRSYNTGTHNGYQYQGCWVRNPATSQWHEIYCLICGGNGTRISGAQEFHYFSGTRALLDHYKIRHNVNPRINVALDGDVYQWVLRRCSRNTQPNHDMPHTPDVEGLTNPAHLLNQPDLR